MCVKVMRSTPAVIEPVGVSRTKVDRLESCIALARSNRVEIDALTMAYGA